jgi:hypothetical protein
MADYVTRDEFAVLESEVEGEKLVTRHILEQTRRNGDDLAALRTRLDRVERKVDALDGKVSGLDGKLSALDSKLRGVDGKVDGLVKALPGIIADTMREVLRERDAR